MRNAAYIFHKKWNSFLAAPVVETLGQRPEEVDVYVWDRTVAFLRVRDKWRWLEKFHCAGMKILLVSETDLRTFMKEKVFTEANMRRWSTGYVSSITSTIRTAFRRVGREHRYGNGQTLEHMLSDQPFVHTGNPMTTALQRELQLMHAAVQARTQGHPVLITVPVERRDDEEEVEEAMEGVEVRPAGWRPGDNDPDSNPRAIVPDKEGGNVSVVLLFWKLMVTLSAWVMDFNRLILGKIHDPTPIINLANNGFLKALLAHEVSRPGDLWRHLRHTDLYIKAHETVYWLTFVFLKPKTLAYLMEKDDALTYYVIEAWKGKFLKQFRGRMKCFIPVHHNVLCLFWHYVVATKAILILDRIRKEREEKKPLTQRKKPESDALSYHKESNNTKGLQSHAGWLWFKQSLDFSSHDSRFNNTVGVLHFTSYSVRYGFTRETLANLMRVPLDWVRWVMGHSMRSNVAETKYARNEKYVQTREGNVSLAGLDVDVPMDQLHLNRLNGATINLTPSWVDDTFEGAEEGLKENFEDVHEKVKTMLEGDPDSTEVKEARESLLAMLPLTNEECLEWMKEVPLGFSLKLADGMLPKSLQPSYDKSVEYLKETFGKPSGPTPSLVPELAAFVQTVFGKWSRGAVPQVTRPPAGEDGGGGGEGGSKRRRVIMVDEGPSAPREEAEESDTESTSSWPWNVKKVRPGNLVVLFCTPKQARSDRCALKLPDDNHVFVAQVVSVEVVKGGKYMLKGRFYWNKEKDAQLRFVRQRQSQDVRIDSRTILLVMGAEERQDVSTWQVDEEEELAGDEIEEVMDLLAKRGNGEDDE